MGHQHSTRTNKPQPLPSTHPPPQTDSGAASMSTLDNFQRKRKREFFQTNMGRGPRHSTPSPIVIRGTASMTMITNRQRKDTHRGSVFKQTQGGGGRRATPIANKIGDKNQNQPHLLRSKSSQLIWSANQAHNSNFFIKWVPSPAKAGCKFAPPTKWKSESINKDPNREATTTRNIWEMPRQLGPREVSRRRPCGPRQPCASPIKYNRGEEGRKSYKTCKVHQ